jgi:capsular polysaccharide biosynthesis protein
LLQSTVRTWFLFVLVGTILGAAIAFAVAVVAPPGFTARVTLLISPAPKAAGITNGDLQIAQGLTPTFAELAATRTVLERVIFTTNVDTDVEHLAQAVTTHVPVGTSLLTISVSNPDAANAAALANAIASELNAYSAPSGGDANTGLLVELKVVDPAIPPGTRDGPGLPVRIALGGAIALFLTISIAFVVENIGRGAQNLGRDIENLGRGPESYDGLGGGREGYAGSTGRGVGFGSANEPPRGQASVGLVPAAEIAEVPPMPGRDSAGKFPTSSRARRRPLSGPGSSPRAGE